MQEFFTTRTPDSFHGSLNNVEFKTFFDIYQGLTKPFFNKPFFKTVWQLRAEPLIKVYGTMFYDQLLMEQLYRKPFQHVPLSFV